MVCHGSHQEKRPILLAFFLPYIYIHTWIPNGVERKFCKRHPVRVKYLRENRGKKRHGPNRNAISAWSKGPRQFKSPVVWAWVPHLSPTQRIHGIDAPETWLQRQTLHLLQDPSRSISRTLHTSWSNTGRLDCLVYYWFILIHIFAPFSGIAAQQSPMGRTIMKNLALSRFRRTNMSEDVWSVEVHITDQGIYIFIISLYLLVSLYITVSVSPSDISVSLFSPYGGGAAGLKMA